ncbi:MAG: replicative DNA helicase [Thermoanaerobaculia bacterium]
MLDALPQPQKSLPHSEESERAVLAAVLIHPPLLATVSGRLTPEDFYVERHGLIYEAMLGLQEDSVEVDLRTLQAKLEQQDRLDSIGGVAYLAGLDVDLPDLGRLDSYVDIVKERSVRRRLIDAATTTIRNCLDGGLPAQEALGLAEQAILSLGEETIRRGFVPLGEILHEAIEEIEERPGKALTGLPTGFVELDSMTRGLNPGNLIIIAGRPGMGKSSLATCIAQYAAIHEGKPVGIFSLEMGRSEVARRILSSEADVPSQALVSGHMSTSQWQKVVRTARKIDRAPLLIDDSSNPTLLEVASKARRLRAEKGLELLIVDYLQLMQAGGRYENRNLELGAISRGMKQLAKELNIPVIALSQLSRQPERRGKDRRPQLADLRESGALEQDSDLVAFIYREEVYDPENPEVEGIAEVIIAKHRNGPLGRIRLAFLKETTTFKNLARGDFEPPSDVF